MTCSRSLYRLTSLHGKPTSTFAFCLLKLLSFPLDQFSWYGCLKWSYSSVWVFLDVFFTLNTIMGVKSMLWVKFHGYLSKHNVAFSRVERGTVPGPEKIRVFLGPYPLLIYSFFWFLKPMSVLWPTHYFLLIYYVTDLNIYGLLGWLDCDTVIVCY